MKDRQENSSDFSQDRWLSSSKHDYPLLGLAAASLMAVQLLCPAAVQSAPSSSTTSDAAKGSPAASARADVSTQIKAKKKHGNLSEDRALQLITNRPEVKAWQKQITSDKKAKERGCTAHIQLDRKEQGSYIVHVFEDVPDGDGSSHSATFNWYHVDEKTARVTKEF